MAGTAMYVSNTSGLQSKNRTWVGSVQGAVATWSMISFLTPCFDQVATAPCTDPTQVRVLHSCGNPCPHSSTQSGVNFVIYI